MYLSKSSYVRHIHRITSQISKQQHCLLCDDGKSSGNNEATPKKIFKVPATENPLSKTFNVIQNDFTKMGKLLRTNNENGKTINSDDNFQSHCDVLIIGGGGIGSSVAYWLKKRGMDGLNVVVVEKDSKYEKSSTCLSVGGLRQQFSLEENIEMSLFAADFMQNIKEHLDDETEINFTPSGYLTLCTEENAEILMQNASLQAELGARNELLTIKQMNKRFPWLNTDGIALGCHGLEKEGWFDSYAMLMGFKRTAQRLGAQYIDAEVVGFEHRQQPDIIMQGVEAGTYEGLDRAIVQMKDGEIRTIKFAMCVLAAGCWSGEIAKLARVGDGPGMLSFSLPVEPRKRYVYVVETQGENCPGLNAPLLVDPSGAYFRRDGLGGNFICGRSPAASQEPSCDNLDVDYSFFDTMVWPELARRVPAFESLRVKNAWAGYYDYNRYDQNPIIGSHPYYQNLFFATGLSGHGIQKVPAIGRAITELIIDGRFRTIDLSRLAFDRLIVDQPMLERNVV